MNNRQIEEALDKIKQQNATELPGEILEALNHISVLVPAVMPKGTNPEIMKKMLQEPGKDHKLPEGANPQPCLLENSNGESLLPAFTSEREMKKSEKAPKFPLVLTLDYPACVRFVQANDKLSGIVLNAFTHNVILRPQKRKETGKDDTQLTVQQYHLMLRQRMESFLLPKTLFEKKAAFVDELCKKKGECLRWLYDTLYDGEIACPYMAEEFEFMILNLKEDLMLCQITMPKKNLTQNMCPSVIFAWNATEQKLWYYAIVLVGGNQEAHLFEVYENGKNVDLGKAPAEGSELSTVIDLIQGSNE